MRRRREAQAGPEPAEREPAIEATSESSVVLNDLRYRVTRFRQFDTTGADRDLLPLAFPGDGSGNEVVCAAAIEVCNVGKRTRTPTDEFALDFTIGVVREEAPLERDAPAAYRATRLQPGECQPSEGSVAGRTVEGGLVAFRFDPSRLQDRPLVLDVRGREENGGGKGRIELDL